MKPGTRSPLNVTQEGNHRIFVGLGWDPNEKPDLKDKISALVGKRQSHHDLDLSCFYFDTHKEYLGTVGADSASHSDPSEKIYHSGDNVEGIGDGDDEQISVELKDLPPEIAHLVFKAFIKSGHHFDDIKDPSIRLCDGYSGHCFLETALQSKYDAFVFVHLYRDGDGWGAHHIAEFLENRDLSQMKEALSGYLD